MAEMDVADSGSTGDLQSILRPSDGVDDPAEPEGNDVGANNDYGGESEDLDESPYSVKVSRGEDEGDDGEDELGVSDEHMSHSRSRYLGDYRSYRDPASHSSP